MGIRITDTISGSVNYTITSADHTIKKIANSPTGVKKILQLTTRIFKAIDLYYESNLSDREFTHAMKGTIDLIGFYGSYKDLIYWVNLFSKESVDHEALQGSIDSSLCASHKNDSKQKILAKQVFDEVMNKETFHSKGEIIQAIEISLTQHGYTPEKAHQIASHVIVQQKKRSSVELLYKACFTVTNLGGNLLNLQKMHVLDLTRFASTIGTQSPVFMLVIKVGADVALGTIASAGLILLIGQTSHKVVVDGMKYYSAAKGQEKEEAYKELCAGLIDLFADSTELAATALPLIYALNPPTILAFALVSKGTGLICFLIKDGH